MNLKRKNFEIRNWKKGDEKSLAENANNKKIWKNLLDTFPHPYTLKDAEFWVRLNSGKDSTDFAIVVDGKAVGGIGFKMRDGEYTGVASIGYWIGEEYWGRGIVSEALKVVSDFAFKKYKVHRLEAGVFSWNAPSARVLEKAGYQFEGKLRKRVNKNGKKVDELMYAKVR